MEAVGAVASVIAIVELAAKVGSSCHRYLVAVKSAESDILRLRNETESLKEIVENVYDRSTRKDVATLLSSPAMLRSLNDCSSQLSNVINKLQPQKRTKLMNKLKLRELKWPFETQEIDKILGSLQGYKQSISLALQLDQLWVTFPTLATEIGRITNSGQLVTRVILVHFGDIGKRRRRALYAVHNGSYMAIRKQSAHVQYMPKED
ncbi:hypothetical protein MMC10_001573 [Thelotrema lepadinum]|nr:hypothetical protein [Thelotrema lepadinum]